MSNLKELKKLATKLVANPQVAIDKTDARKKIAEIAAATYTPDIKNTLGLIAKETNVLGANVQKLESNLALLRKMTATFGGEGDSLTMFVEVPGVAVRDSIDLKSKTIEKIQADKADAAIWNKLTKVEQKNKENLVAALLNFDVLLNKTEQEAEKADGLIAVNKFIADDNAAVINQVLGLLIEGNLAGFDKVDSPVDAYQIINDLFGIKEVEKRDGYGIPNYYYLNGVEAKARVRGVGGVKNIIAELMLANNVVIPANSDYEIVNSLFQPKKKAGSSKRPPKSTIGLIKAANGIKNIINSYKTKTGDKVVDLSSTIKTS